MVNIHASPPKVDSSKGPNRVNSAHWPTKKKINNKYILWIFFRPRGKMPEMAPNGARRFLFLRIQTSPSFCAKQILILVLIIVMFRFFCLTLDFQNSRFLNFPIPGFPDSWILEPGSLLWLAADRGGTSRRFLNGTPGPQNAGDPRN